MRLFLSILFICIFVACSKKDKPAPSPEKKTKPDSKIKKPKAKPESQYLVFSDKVPKIDRLTKIVHKAPVHASSVIFTADSKYLVVVRGLIVVEY